MSMPIHTFDMRDLPDGGAEMREYARKIGVLRRDLRALGVSEDEVDRVIDSVADFGDEVPDAVGAFAYYLE
jgi:hypothetical protein